MNDDLGLLAGGAKTERFNIPIEHLDFKYVSQCKDVRELEKIYRLLKSGEEGSYPELTEHTANRLKELAPKSRALRKNEPLLRASDLDREEQETLASDLQEWQSSMREWRAEAAGASDVIEIVDAPPPRTAKNLLLSSSGNRTETANPSVASSHVSSGSKKKRHVPRTPDEWAKLEQQLEEQEQREEEEAKKRVDAAPTPVPANKKADPLPFKSKMPPTLAVDPLTTRAERQRIADGEKDKGNEAFRSSDYQEALVYYCRSLSVLPQPSVLNNRALTYIKLKKWNDAIHDCSKVIKSEPNNVKALLRRATSLTEEHRLAEARRDTEAVLKLEPDDRRAAKLLSDIIAEEEKRSKRQEQGSRRMIIEESSSEEEEEKEEKEAKEELKEGERRLTIEECDDEEEEEEEEEEPVATRSAPTESAAPPERPPTSAPVLPPSTTPPPSIPTAAPSKTSPTSSVPKPTSVPASAASQPSSYSSPPSSASQSDIWTEEDLERRSRPVPTPKPVPVPTTPPKQLTTEEEFLQQKELGNQCVKENKFSEALKFYDRCVQLCPDNIIGYNNRAVVHIRLERFNDAIYDCNMVLDTDRSNVKALFRRGLARKHLGDYPESLVDFRAAMIFDPTNATILSEINEVQDLLKETGGRRRVRIQEIEEEEEEEEEKEEEEEEVGETAEDVPVIREAWPEGVPRDWASKAKEEMDKVKKEVEEERRRTEEKKRLEGETTQLGQESGKEEVEDEMRKVTAEIAREKAELEALRRVNEQKRGGKKLLIEEIETDSETEKEEEEDKEAEGEKEEKEEEEERKEKEKEEEERKVKEEEEEGKEKEDEAKEETAPMEEGGRGDKKEEGREEEDAESGGSWVEVEEDMLREDVAAASNSTYQTGASGDRLPVTPSRLMTALLTSKPSTARVGAMLLEVPPAQLPQYVSSQLDQKSLVCLISTLHDELLPRQKFSLVCEFLAAILRIKRFNIVRMFLGENSLKDLRDLFQVLEDVQASGNLPEFSAEDLSAVRKSFSV